MVEYLFNRFRGNYAFGVAMEVELLDRAKFLYFSGLKDKGECVRQAMKELLTLDYVVKHSRLFDISTSESVAHIELCVFKKMTNI